MPQLWAQSVDLDSLLVQSLGGQASVQRLETMTSYYSRGRLDLNGMQGTFEMHAVLPDKIHMLMDFGGFRVLRGYDGTTAWTIDHNGSVSEIGGYEKRDMEETVWFLSAAFLSGEPSLGGRAYLGKTQFRDEEFHVVALYPYHRDTVTCYLDPRTALMTYRVNNNDNVEMVTRLSDYRPIETIQEAHLAEMTAAAANLRAVMTVDTVMYDVPIPVSLFARPDARTGDYRFPAGVASVVLPLKVHRGHVFVEARINGAEPTWFLLDSGASTNLLNRSLAMLLQLPEVGSMVAKGVSGFDNVVMVKTDSISIGQLTLFSQVAGAVDLPFAATHLGADSILGGLLGYDFLSRFPVMVDYQKAELTVFDPEAFVAPVGGHEIPFYLMMQIPTVTVSVAGAEGDFIVDLGNALGLVLHKEFWDRAELTNVLTEIDSGAALYGVGGSVSGLTAVAPSVTLGPLVRSDVPVTLTAASSGLTGSVEVAGNIGGRFLRDYRVLFDYAASRLILYPLGN